MKRFLNIATAMLGFLSVLVPQLSIASEEFAPSVAFTIRDNLPPGMIDGIPDAVDFEPGFIGQVTGPVVDSAFTEETFFEYDVSTVASSVASAMLSLKVLYSDTGNENGTGKLISYSTYSGSGLPDISRWGTGTLLERIHLPTNPSVVGEQFSFSIDVTSELNAAIDRGDSYFGVRAHDVQFAPGSPLFGQLAQLVHGQANQLFPQTLIVTLAVPEPTGVTAWLALGIGAIAVGRGRRSYRAMRSWN